jgi:hypothetical protein
MSLFDSVCDEPSNAFYKSYGASKQLLLRSGEKKFILTYVRSFFKDILETEHWKCCLTLVQNLLKMGQRSVLQSNGLPL